MRVFIDKDEWYPVYCFDLDDFGVEAELTTEEIDTVNDAFTRFKRAQEILRTKYKEAKGGRGQGV